MEPTDPSPEAALRRELWEELGIHLPEVLRYVGAWPWGGAIHQIYVARLDFDNPRIDFDENEIRRAEWFSLAEIRSLEARRGLHTGFEYLAVKAALAKLGVQRGFR
jgi:NADH pyrophosphatase NudC (nudix superfamily)